MTAVHIVVGSIAIAINLAAGVWGAVCWYWQRASVIFWRLLRSGQVLVVLEAVLGGIWMATGRKVTELHLIYGLLPIGVSFMAEQLRINAAQMILDKRGFESTKQVAKLPEDQQRALVLTVVRREVGVMCLSALVVTVLLARAATVY